MRSFMIRTLAAGLVLLVGVGAAHAMSVEPVSPEQVLANAEMIVVGTVTDVRTRWSGLAESMIATDYTITLDRIVHDPDAQYGAKAKGETIVLSFAGGTIGEKWVAVPGVPTYELGEQVIFFIDGDWIHGVSPLVGVMAGGYRVSSDNGPVTDYTGALVDRTFFSGGIDKANGFTVDEFVAEITRALPFAEADKSLEMGDAVEIPDDIRHLVFSGDQIPMAQPMIGSFVAPSHDVVMPVPDAAAPAPVPEPKEPLFIPNGSDQDVLMTPSADKYAFLWLPPDFTSNFNIPPIYYSGALWGPNFEYSLSDWNRYADLFRKFTESENTFGHQGRNDFAFTDWTTFQTVYGFSLPSTVLGIAVMYNSAGNNISTGEKIYESDIILNVDKSWTLDWAVGYANCSIWYFRSTVVHEAGHCFGREHQFTADPAALYHSVMNYPPCGALDTEFWLPLVDDPQSIRVAYPGRIVAINDLGVELFRTAGGGGSSGIPVVWSTFNSTVVAGQSFSMNNFIIENLGTVADTPAIGWWLCPNQQDYTGAHYMMSTSHTPLGVFAYWNTSRTLTVPVSVPPGNYYIAAALASDDHDWNRSCWTNTRITVTCPQVATPTGFSCTAGCGYIDLSWNAATNATSYRVYRDGALFVTTGATSYRDNSPGASQRCYRVAGLNSCDTSTQSAQSCCTALAVPASVASLSCTAGCGYIDVSWNATSGATSYYLYRDAVLLTTTAGTSYRDNSPGASERCYAVRAANACGLAPATITSCCTALSTPPALSALSCSPLCGAISLDWSPSASATSYRVYRDGSFYTSVQGSGYQDNNPGTGERCYHVTAVNGCGESGDSPRACCTAEQVPVAPTSLTCSEGCGYISLVWTTSDGAWQYHIYRDGALIASTGGLTFQDNGPGVGEHCYHIVAEGDCGVSGDSPRACCTADWPPEMVPFVEATTHLCDTILIRWDAVPGATGYRLYRDGNGLASVGPAPTAYTDVVSGDSCYGYTVTALNDCGEGLRSEEVVGCSVCEPDVYRIEGYMVYYDMIKHIPDVTVDLTGAAVATTSSDAAGYYWFDGLVPGVYQVTPSRLTDDDGVSIGDVVKIRRHLAVIELFDSPYKYVAADVGCNGSVSVSDVVKVRRYLAQLEPLPCGNWVFVDSSFAINDANWFTAPQLIEGNLTYDWTDSSFVGVRLGDVNNTWATVGPATIAERRAGATYATGSATVVVRDVREAMVGNVVEVQVAATNAGQLAGVELHLIYGTHELTYLDAVSGTIDGFTINAEFDNIHVVWEDLDNPVDASEHAELVTVRFRVNDGMTDSGEITVDGEIVDLMGDPYAADFESGFVVLASPSAVGPDEGLVPRSYYLDANFPNPFNPETHISFGLPQSSHVTLCIYNMVGRRVKCLVDGTYNAGDHQVVWNGRDEAGDLVGSGVYFYRLDAGDFTQTRKMTLMK